MRVYCTTVDFGTRKRERKSPAIDLVTFLMEVDTEHEPRAYVQSGEEVAVVVGAVCTCSFLR